MGLLDDLKKQADTLKTQSVQSQTVQTGKIKLVEDKMKQTFLYVNDLLKQLVVVKPANPLIFSIPGVASLQGLTFADSFIDYRRKRIADKEYYDTITFFIKWTSDKTIVMEYNDAIAAQKAREAIWASKMKFTEEEKKSPKGFLMGAKYTIPAVVVSDVVIKADHDNAKLLVQAKNLFSIGVEQLEIPVLEINEALLEELAKALIGQQSGILKFKIASEKDKAAPGMPGMAPGMQKPGMPAGAPGMARPAMPGAPGAVPPGMQAGAPKAPGAPGAVPPSPPGALKK